MLFIDFQLILELILLITFKALYGLAPAFVSFFAQTYWNSTSDPATKPSK